MQEHDPGCRRTVHSDAAKRVCDAVNLHVSALGFEAMKKWVACRLSDGKSDGTLYDSRVDAIRHQSDEKKYAYVPIPPGGLNVCKAESILLFARFQNAGGFAGLIDRDDPRGGRLLIPSLTIEDQMAQLRHLQLIAARN